MTFLRIPAIVDFHRASHIILLILKYTILSLMINSNNKQKTAYVGMYVGTE